MAQQAHPNFSRENRSDRSKSQKLNTFIDHLRCADLQNRVQNRQFSENRRWGRYKKLLSIILTPPVGGASLFLFLHILTFNREFHSTKVRSSAPAARAPALLVCPFVR